MFERRLIGRSTRERQSLAFAWPERCSISGSSGAFYREGFRLTERALSLPGPVPAPVRAKGLITAGWLARLQNERETAAARLTEASPLRRTAAVRRVSPWR